MKKLLNFINTKILKNKKLLTIFAVFAFLLLCLPATAHAHGGADAGLLFFAGVSLFTNVVALVFLIIPIFISNKIGLIIITIVNFLLFMCFLLLGRSFVLDSRIHLIGPDFLLSAVLCALGILIAVLKPNFPITFRNIVLVILALIFICTAVEIIFRRISSPEYQHNKLRKAVINNDIERVKQQLSEGVNIDYKNQRNPALSVAIYQKNKKMVELLLNSGVNINEPSAFEKYPLAEAIEDKEMFEFLLSKGANINCGEGNVKTPLGHMAEKNNVELMKFAISKGANIDSRDKFGSTPLYYAINNGAKEAAEYLISKGANIENLDYMGRTPLLLAVENGRAEIAEYLISKGANVNGKDKYGNNTLLALVKSSRIKDESARLKLAKFLISKGADVNMPNIYEETALHKVVYDKQKEMTKFLLDNGANINAIDNSGNTPLDETYSNEDMKQFLLSYGAKSGDELK